MLLSWLTTLYLLALAGLSLYGLFGLVTLAYYWHHRRDTFLCPPMPEAAWPTVTVQLPLYNERYVVARLLHAVSRLDYPAERLQIQVLDDSTDETTALCRTLVAGYQANGMDIQLLHRPGRQGYKAGALQAAMPQARGEFIAIFDADFCPPPDFLKRTLPHFWAREDVGLVQVRWSHLNERQSVLTAVQAIALDKHFAVDQEVRFRAGLFPKFNGSAGIWRRRCVEDAGGWEEDTVTEDLCLSTRAVLRGWQFRFVDEIVAPAELPGSISAFKNQQARWAKGATQCLVKFGGPILHSRRHRLAARLYALFSLSAYSAHLLLLLLLLLSVPLAGLDVRFSPRLALLGLAGIGQPVLFVLSQQVLYPDWPRRLRYLPALLLVAVGLAASNSRAVLEALFGRQHSFVRTPKGNPGGREPAYRLPFDPIILLELWLAVYAGIGLVLALRQGNNGPLFLLATCLLSFGGVGFLSLREQF